MSLVLGTRSTQLHIHIEPCSKIGEVVDVLEPPKQQLFTTE